MTEIEFNILDELYFVTNKKNLLTAIDYPEEQVLDSLKNLITLGDVKCLKEDRDITVTIDEIDSIFQDDRITFLATKKGLFRHNSI